MPSTASRLTIDLDALAHNFHVLRKAAQGASVAPAVKADAYGLGADQVARRLWAEGARSFFVARLEEGEALRQALGPSKQAMIFVLDGATPGSQERLVASYLIPCLNSLDQVDAWSAHGVGLGTRLPASLHVDTGMNRLGLRVEEAAALSAAPERLRGVSLELVLSHLAAATDPTHPLNAQQLALFAGVRGLFPDLPGSLANSAGVFMGGGFLHDLVRPGVSLYGSGAFETTDDRLRPVATFEAPIVQIRDVPAGESIGYDAAFVAERDMRIAVVGAGYADGVMRAFAPRGYGWLAGARRSVAGKLSMDLIAFDVTGCDAAQPGAMIELLGPNVRLNDAAIAAGTIAYEVLVSLSPRAEHVYIG